MTCSTHTRLLFVGDVMLGRLVNEVLEQAPPEYPWGDTLPLFRGADWRCCNLECVLSDRGQPGAATPKAFHFRSDARNVAVLKTAGVNAVSLANNHTLDFDHVALMDMLRSLDNAGIAHSGAGANLVAAANPAIAEVQGLRVGLISFTDNQPEWEATPESAGVFHVPTDVGDQRTSKLFELIRYTRQRVNLLIVAAHWGPNWGYAPPPAQIPFGHALIDAGADVVFGHSGHVCRGIEIHHGRPVIYSAGDFIDDYAVDKVERNDRSFVFVVEVAGGALHQLKLYPTAIRMCQACLARGAEAEETARQMRRLCLDLGTEARWNAGGHCLEIDLAETGSPRPCDGLKRH